MSSSSLDEKEKELALQDPQTATQNPKRYESIVTDGDAAEKDIEANTGAQQNAPGRLSRLQSSTSARSEYTESISDTKSSTIGKKRWYKRMNPLKWGPKPPVPAERDVCPEYGASWFALLTFQWMAPLMTVRRNALD